MRTSLVRAGIRAGVLSLFFLQPVQANIVGYWNFDETAGPSAADSSGRGNTGALVNGPAWIAGKVGGALGLDGMDDYVDAGAGPSLNPSGDHSVAAWVWIDGSMGGRGVIARWSGSSAIGLCTDGSGQLFYDYTDTGGTIRTLADPGALRAAPGSWHHVAEIVQRASSTVAFYVDGQLSGRATWSANSPTAASSGIFCIGGSLGTRAFKGGIDEVIVQDRALAAAEIAALAAAPYPAPVNFAKPNPEPALQPGMDPFFAPPIRTVTPRFTAPSFGEWSRDADAGDTVLASGDKFSSYSGDDEGKDTRFVVYGQNASEMVLTAAQIERLDNNKTAFLLDPTLPTKSMYWVWPQNSQGYGRPIAINQTEAWWLGPKAAKAGDSISLYGRNLSFEDGTKKAWIYVKPSLGEGQWAEVTEANPYRVTFTVPSLSNGTYQVWAHNGHGASWGWSGPITLTINGGISWTSAQFDVTATAYGAKGNDTADDTTAINKALTAAASSPYSTVYFPAGTYYVSALTLPSNVRLKGAGKDVAIIKGKSGASSVMITAWGKTNIEIRDLTLDTGTSSPNGTWTRTLLSVANGMNSLRLENVALIAKGYNPNSTSPGMLSDWLAATPSTSTGTNTNLFFVDCDFKGQLFNLIGTQIFLDRCHMAAMNDGNMVELSGSSDVSVTHCTWQDSDNSSDATGTGWGLGRFVIVRNLSKQFATNHYYGDNVITDSGMRRNKSEFLNYGEIFLFEYNWAPYVSQVTTSVATVTTLAATFPASTDTNTPVIGMAAVIINGKGLGQFRRISAIDRTNNKITVSPGWNVTPDSTSKIVFQRALTKAVLYGNVIDGKESHVRTDPATAQLGVMIQGCLDFTMANNTIKECRGGINPYTFGAGEAGGTGSPPVPGFFQLIKNNTFQTTRVAVRDRFNGLSVTSRQDGSVYTFAHAFRNNTIIEALEVPFAVKYNTTTETDAYYPDPVMEMILMEHNHVSNSPKGYFRESDSWSKIGTVLLLNNDFVRGTTPTITTSYGTSTPLSAKPVLGGNTYSGFPTNYYQTLAPVLEAPYRTLTIQGSVGSTPQTGNVFVWNSGSASLPWSISSDSSWLSADQASGTTANENTVSTIVATAHADGLTPGTYAGAFTLSTGSGQTLQKKKIGVEFLVSATPSPTPEPTPNPTATPEPASTPDITPLPVSTPKSVAPLVLDIGIHPEAAKYLTSSSAVKIKGRAGKGVRRIRYIISKRHGQFFTSVRNGKWAFRIAGLPKGTVKVSICGISADGTRVTPKKIKIVRK